MAVCFFAAPALADKRVALVVGNGTYRNVAWLDNPANDARLVADTLHDLGFALVAEARNLISTKLHLTGSCRTSERNCREPMSGCSSMPVTACRCAAPTT